MFTNFKELEAYVLSHKNKKRIVLANAHDEPALSAVVNAHRRGVVDGTLLGKKDEILALLQEMNEDPAEYGYPRGTRRGSFLPLVALCSL